MPAAKGQAGGSSRLPFVDFNVLVLPVSYRKCHDVSRPETGAAFINRPALASSGSIFPLESIHWIALSPPEPLPALLIHERSRAGHIEFPGGIQGPHHVIQHRDGGSARLQLVRVESQRVERSAEGVEDVSGAPCEAT